jgi:hypothetical protein
MSLRDPDRSKCSGLPALTRLVIMSAILLVGGCDCFREEFGDPTLDPEPAEATALELDLEEVQVTPAVPTNGAANGPRKLMLSAWYLDSARSILYDAGTMQWRFHPTAEGSAAPGEVTVSTYPNPPSAPGEIRVSGGRLADTVKVVRWPNPGAARSGSDIVEIVEPARDLAERPSVVLLEEASAGKCTWGPARAFLGVAAVGELTGDPCSLSVISAGHGMQLKDKTKWPTGHWATTGANLRVTPVVPLKLRVTVFIAASGNVPLTWADATQSAEIQGTNPTVTPLDYAENDVRLANELYETNRTGVTIEAKYQTLPPSDDITAKVGADPYDCVLPVKLPADPNQVEFWYDSSAVSVYYVDQINYPPEPEPPRVRGIQCHYWYSGNPKVGTRAAIGHPDLGKPPGNGPVIYISLKHRSEVTLAHELGHSLGLNDVEGKLGALDVMHNLLPTQALNNARSRFTVGQVFRMNVWNDSWINTRLPRPPQRACDEAQEPCPPVELDVY